MRPLYRMLLAFTLLQTITATTSADTASNIMALLPVAYALGWLMMVILGIKWIVAESPNDRAEAKKGMIYVIIGLLVVASYCQLMCLYTKNASISLGGTVTFDLGPYNCLAPCS
ncbi:MAG: pilin [Candidatus Altiarchaeota archaeon]